MLKPSFIGIAFLIISDMFWGLAFIILKFLTGCSAAEIALGKYLTKGTSLRLFKFFPFLQNEYEAVYVPAFHTVLPDIPYKALISPGSHGISSAFSFYPPDK